MPIYTLCSLFPHPFPEHVPLLQAWISAVFSQGNTSLPVHVSEPGQGISELSTCLGPPWPLGGHFRTISVHIDFAIGNYPQFIGLWSQMQEISSEALQRNWSLFGSRSRFRYRYWLVVRYRVQGPVPVCMSSWSGTGSGSGARSGSGYGTGSGLSSVLGSDTGLWLVGKKDDDS